MPHSNSFCYEFEQHRLDVAQRVLTREGQSIPLTPKATDVLLLLLQNAGQLVEKDELMNQVWPDAFVEEANLTQNIFQLRRALKDDGSGPKYIETVARRGYRFVAPVKRVAVEVVQQEDPLASVRKSAIPILAVLPFGNDTGNIDLQYLAEGIPESIINSLSSLSQLRVISRSSAFRYKKRQVDPQATGKKLGADVLLVGTISGRESALAVSVELVSVENAWQLWGQTFKVDSENIFEVQDEITRQISRVLRLPLTHEDETRVAKRYTESPQAYQAYLEGRYYWSQYTKVGIEKAIVHFERAIELDPNYALAYAGVVDCYLRLATNYLPPEDALPLPDGVDFESELTEVLPSLKPDGVAAVQIADEKVKLRHEWDWKGAERELRRANELRTDYPAAHQWHAALVFSRDLFYECGNRSPAVSPASSPVNSTPRSKMARQISSLQLTPSERVQVFCTVAREQIAVGNYEAGERMLAPWLSHTSLGDLSGLSLPAAADLLFTLGTLAGYLSSAGVTSIGQRQAELLLSGAIAVFECTGIEIRSAESRIELARCYYREGLFNEARSQLKLALGVLHTDQDELKSLCAVLLAAVNRDSGRLRESLSDLQMALDIEKTGQLVTGRCQHELATTLKELAVAENDEAYALRAANHFRQALDESEAIGNHRLTAATDNNLGYLLMTLGQAVLAEHHLLRARSRFERFNDRVRRAQVNETLARLYLSTNEYRSALTYIEEAVSVLELTDEEAIVSEALNTKAVVLGKLGRIRESKNCFAGAYKVAERSGHVEGAASSVLMMLEELCEELDDEERDIAGAQLARLFVSSRPTSLRSRIANILDHLRKTHQISISITLAE